PEPERARSGSGARALSHDVENHGGLQAHTVRSALEVVAFDALAPHGFLDALLRDAAQPVERRRFRRAQREQRQQREQRRRRSTYHRSSRSGMMLVHHMTPIVSADRLKAVASALGGSRRAAASVGITVQTSAA